MNDCPRVRRSFWHPVLLPTAVWAMLMAPVMTIGEDLPLPAYVAGLSVYLLLGAFLQVLIGLPLLSLFNSVRQFWPRVWLAGFAAQLVSAPLSLFGSYREALLLFLPPFLLGAAYTHYRNRQPSSEQTPSSVDPAVEVHAWFGIFLSALVICRLTLLLQEPGTGHSSLDPWSASTIFLPTGALGFFARGRRTYRWTALLACAVCLTGMSLLFYLDHTSRYLQYMEWMRRSKEGLLSSSPQGERK